MSPRKILTIPSDVHCQSTFKQLGITTMRDVTTISFQDSSSWESQQSTFKQLISKQSTFKQLGITTIRDVTTIRDHNN